ncbi:hypothetical protein [Paenibacillus sp. y28]|uniref:hypothetical protein n=1 Tax=Paenibacillus sp. y28 TaxID=3129110 RepID=UPI0030190C5F
MRQFDLFERRERLKLDLLESLVRSQQALAVMLENTAGAIVHAQAADSQLRDNLVKISMYQRVLADKMMNVRVFTNRGGHPALPWLHPQVLRGRRGKEAVYQHQRNG